MSLEIRHELCAYADWNQNKTDKSADLWNKNKKMPFVVQSVVADRKLILSIFDRRQQLKGNVRVDERDDRILLPVDSH